MSTSLNEITRKDILSDVGRVIKGRSKSLPRLSYLGITEDHIVRYLVSSATDTRTKYLVNILLVEYKDLEGDESLSTRDKVLLAIDGDIKVNCDCPSFLYHGYKYIMTQLDGVLGDGESRYPEVRNPKLQGVVCKHLYLALKALGTSWMTIASDIDRGHYID